MNNLDEGQTKRRWHTSLITLRGDCLHEGVMDLVYISITGLHFADDPEPYLGATSFLNHPCFPPNFPFPPSSVRKNMSPY